MKNLNEANHFLEKPFDEKFIGVVPDYTAGGVGNNIQGFHRSAEAHFFLQDFGKKRVDQDDLNVIREFDFGKGGYQAKAQCGKYT